MKLTKTLSISLATFVFAATISTGTALATEQEAQTVYPDSFECSLSFDSGLTDYAVYGDNYAFAYNGQLTVLSGNGNGGRLCDIKHKSSITGLEYSPQGALYVCFEDGYCVYPDMENKFNLNNIDITVQDKAQRGVQLSDCFYYLSLTTGQLIYNTSTTEEQVTPQVAVSGEVKFSKLKKYNDTAYAVMNNCLYKMEGATAVKVEPTYLNVDLAKSIATGNAKAALQEGSSFSYGIIEKNKYYTQINLENGLGATFDVTDAVSATKLSEDTLYCTILAESGNAYIVSMNGNTYLTAKTSVTVDATTPKIDAPDVEKAYSIYEIGIYSRPYQSEATRLCYLESGSTNAVTVLGQLTDSGIDYYKINYTKSDGSFGTGYVAKKFMTGYAFPAEDVPEHNDGGDGKFVYDSNVVTVILAVAIVALVLIAVLYISIASSKNNKKRDRQKANKKKIAEREQRRTQDGADEADNEE